MLVPLLAFAILSSDLCHVSSATLTDLLPDLLVHTLNHSRAVNGSSIDDYQGAPLTTLQLDIKPGRLYTRLLLQEPKDVPTAIVNVNDENLSKRDFIVKHSPLAHRRQYIFVVSDQGDVKSTDQSVAFRRRFGFQNPLVTRGLSADSLAAVRRRVKRRKRSLAGDDSKFQAHALLSDSHQPKDIFDAYRGNLTRDGVVPHFLADVPKQLINVDYGYGRKIRMGNFFVSQQLWLEPLHVSFDMKEGNLYTLFLTDITFMFWQYWLVVNIVTKDVYSGDELILYSGPFPTSGRPETLVFLLYSQGSRVIEIAEFKGETGYDLATKDPRVFAHEWNLGDPVAINYFLTDAERDDVRAAFINNREAEKRKKRRELILERRKTKEPLLKVTKEAEAEIKQPEEANNCHVSRLWWPLLLMCFIR
ncbi:uncharacterized protein LOC135374017 [Ornithodoros turicata]|uniref:uncharacterized protein LOC135374017 n=1 Tax=Ornithodoros turicata TaxID=34597 RepID=UPI003139EF73